MFLKINKTKSTLMKLRHRIRHSKLCLIMISLVLVTSVWAQNKTVTGIVTDVQGETLLGVTVAVEGTTIGSITDIEGSYTLQVPENAKTLRFSFMGMETVTVAIGTQKVINAQLKSTSLGMEELVVVGYGTQKKVTITGALSTIKSEDIMASPSASAANSLAGKMTGLTSIQSSGQPGADDPELLVRGMSTLNNSSPLIMVDGVERAFSQLDPNEIDDITILKDASATAVYGIRGANGVILVTTKRGMKGKPQISISTSFGVQSPVRVPEFADSYTYAKTYRDAEIMDGTDPAKTTFSEEALKAFETNSDPILYPNTDWMDYMLKDYSTMSTTNFNIGGGTDRVRYFASFGILNQDGMLKEFNSGTNENFSFNRYNYRTNLDIDVTKKTVLKFTMGGRTIVRNEPATGNINEMWRMLYRYSIPWTSPGVVDGKYIQDNGEYITLDSQDPLTMYYGQGFRNVNQTTLNIDVNLTQDLSAITKGLNFSLKTSYNSNYTQTKTRTANPNIYTAYYKRDYDPSLGSDDKTLVFPLIQRKVIPKYSEGYDKGRNWYLESALNYNRKFGDHEVSGLLLYNQRSYYYPKGNFSDIPARYIGSAARVTYNYKTKYLAEVNVGYNGSENFHEDRRYGLFPAFSLGWVISEENFIKNNIPFIQYMKLRTSWGLVGNDKMGNNRFLYLPNGYSAGGGYNFGVDVSSYQPGFIESKIGNPFVTWETATKQNYGIDLTVLEKRLAINLDYFKDHRENILAVQNTIGLVTGLEPWLLPQANIAVVDNKGYEASIKWNSKINDFNYWASLNYSHNENTIVFMDEIKQNEPYMAQTGGLIGQPFGRIGEGFYTDEYFDITIDNAGKKTYLLKNQYAKPTADVMPGDAIYKDINKDGFIDDNDVTAIGYPRYPLTTVGLTMGFKYKGFDLSMNWVGATHTSRSISGSLRVPYGETGQFSLLQHHVNEQWTPETAETATQPRITFSNHAHNRGTESTIWVRDASYIRLKNVDFGYSFSGKNLQKFGAKSLRIYINGYNLLLIDKMDGLVDPETKTGNQPTYPVMKIYNIGAKVNF